MYIRNGFTQVTLKQFELMAHTIGFERKRIKYNKHVCHRNYFTSLENAENTKDLNELVEVGLMEKKEFDGDMVFWVTDWGFMLFGDIFDCKVYEGN